MRDCAMILKMALDSGEVQDCANHMPIALRRTFVVEQFDQFD